MSSYLRGWLPSPASFFPLATPAPPVPSLEVTVDSPPASDDEGEDTETEGDRGDEYDDTPPSFPSLNSAQRVGSASSSATASLSKISTTTTTRTISEIRPTIINKGGDNSLMPPPPLPSLATRTPGVGLRTKTTTLSLPEAASEPGLLAPLHTTQKPVVQSKGRGKKVALAPGHSPLDWAALKASGTDLRGVDSLARIPPSVLKRHNKKDDAWTAIHGKVYNMTAYLPFHPGGERELMRAAGRDGTKLFALTHAWVNVDFMMDECMVGFLVPEPSS